MSKRELESILTEAAQLLDAEGYSDRGDWMRERLAQLVACDTDRTVLPILDELQPIWGGMGSFSDLPWSADASQKMWDICYRVSDALDGCRAECSV